jgi:death-on-curing protein
LWSSIPNCFAVWLSDILSNPTFDEAIAVHARLIARFGGSLGIRDRGALESALARPQTGYYTELIQEAAALWESLSQNHPFLDGNKRVAVTVTAAFLKINGYKLEFDDLEAYAFLINLYESNRMRFQELENWLRRHVSAA